MEEELNYASVVFKNGDKPTTEKNEDLTIYSTVKSKGPATTAPTDGEAAAHTQRFLLLAVCLGIVCVLLVASISAIIGISVVMDKQRVAFQANLDNLTAENKQLITEKIVLENKTEELSRDRDDLNWMLNFIMKFSSFPVNEYCPNKKCQPCKTDWMLFQKKCYLFYNKGPPYKTWQESRRLCQNTAADLVVIDSLQEQEFISNHSQYYFDNEHGYWFGLKQTANKNWLWVDGRKDTLGFWLKEGLGTPGPCALIIPRREPAASWDPATCDFQNRFICESDALILPN